MNRTKVLLSQLLVANVLIFTNSSAFADLVPDNTLGTEASRIRQNNSINDLNIEGGAIRGSNIFHSFSQFNINNGQSVYFSNPAGVQNILTRVTGGQVSNILGTLGVNGSANLFLINPSGIVFGENARLDINGSFIATSASNIKFLDGSEFNAELPQEKPLLTISVPVGLGMGNNPGEIKVLGPGSGIAYINSKEEPRPQTDSSAVGLSVKPGKTLGLLGGNVIINGGVIRSPAGRIEIGSAASNAQVSLVPITEGWKLGYETVPNFADIQMSDKAFVSAAGVGGAYISLRGRNINLSGESFLIADTKGDRNGGEIRIVGESITLNRADVSNNTFGSGNAGKIEIFANKSIQLENEAAVGSHTTGKGDAGEIVLSADSITIKNQSGMGGTTRGNETGRGGRFVIKANSLLLEDSSGFAAKSFSRGNAGIIDITTGNLEILNGSGMNTTSESSGNGGKINITTNSLLIEKNSGLTSNAGKDSIAKAEEINIIANSLVLKNSASIDSNTLGAGEAGKINISTKYLLMEESVGINSLSKDGSTGQAGEINITAGSLVLRNNSSIDGKTTNARDAGKINITANSFIIKNQSQVRSNTTLNASGKAGIINIKSDLLLMEDATGIVTQSFGRGEAGVINLNIGDMIVRNNSGLSSNANSSGNGGQINITANSLLIENNSGPDNSTRNDKGRGGNFNINVKGSFILRNRSGIGTNTFSSGEAGQINLTADYFEVSNSSGMSATTNSSGNAGNLKIQARTLVINKGNFEVGSTGSVRAGDLDIVADNILLNDAKILATTSSDNGGNLTLNVASLLQLSNKTHISTTAGTANAGGGNGGNITINAPNGFIVGVPNGNSDITANAFNGKGGNVIINAAGIFGMEVRSQEQLNPSFLETNDITAISQQSPSLNGVVTINTPYVKPNSELVNLPSVPVDTKMSQGCYGANQSQSRFVNIGRSGLPPNPADFIDGDIVDVDWVAIKPLSGKYRQENALIPSVSKVTANSSSEKIVEATGWIVNEKGIVMLVANSNSDGYSYRQSPNVNSCLK